MGLFAHLYSIPSWYSMTWSEWCHPISGSSFRTQWNGRTCLQHSGFSWELVSFWPDSEHWWEWWHILAIRLEATESSGGWSSLWQPEGKRLQAEEYNKTSKVLREGRDKTVREIKRFKNCHIYRRIGGEKSNWTDAGKTYPQKKAET